MVELIASDGHNLDAYRADLPGKARGAVVVVQEIFGVNSHIRSVADGYAADGYVAIAPSLFDRVRRNVELGYGPEDIAAGRELKAASQAGSALLDIVGVVISPGWLRQKCMASPARRFTMAAASSITPTSSCAARSWVT